MRKIFLLAFLIAFSVNSKSWADTYQVYMPSTMPGALSLAPSQFYIVNTDSRSTVSVDTDSYISSYDISNWSFDSNDFVQVDGSSLDSGKSNPRIFQDFKGSSLTIRENRLVTVRDKGPDGIANGDPGDTGDDGENRTYDRLITINTADGSVASQTLIASNQSDYDHAVTNGYQVVLEGKSATPDQLAVMELFQMTTYSENLTNSGSMVGDAIETKGSFSTTKITDANGVSLFRQEDDGSIHIGENSVVIVDKPNSSSGNDMIYSSAAGGSTLQIGNLDSHRTIIKGTLEVNGISVLDSLRGLGDGVEGSAALTAALSSVPSSAPDYEYYCGGGLGAYGSSQAAALGCAKDHSETLSFHAGASYLLGGGEAYGVDEFSDFAFKAGFTYKFGKKSKSNPVETASINAAALAASSKVEQTKLKAQVNDLSHKLAISTVEQTKLKAQVNDLSQTLAVLAKKLEVNTASINSGSQTDKVAMAR